MKDELGLYYFPSMQSQEVRMYVREIEGRIEFRMWNQSISDVWDRHMWLPYDVIEKAAAMYKDRGEADERNPLALYDLNIAKRLIKDDK
ncbi:MAG: hypothetical protein ACNI27_15040 [Desulfovibrio sp.]